MTFLYMTVLFLMTVVVIGSTVWCTLRLTAPKAADAEALASLEKSGEKVVGAYIKLEEGTVGTYKKIENGVVGAYQKVEDGFVDRFLVREGETVEEAKARLKQDKK